MIGVSVKVYKCEAMAETCGSCLTINATYGCGWCGTKCAISENCKGHAWLDSTQICPNPSIDSVSQGALEHLCQFFAYDRQ